MPRRDKFHDAAKVALEKDGWEIAYDPLFIPTEGDFNFFIDLGLRGIIGARRENEKNSSRNQDLAGTVRNVQFLMEHWGNFSFMSWL